MSILILLYLEKSNRYRLFRKTTIYSIIEFIDQLGEFVFQSSEE